MAASRSFRVGTLCVLWLLAACIVLLHSALQYTVLSSKSSSPAPRTHDASVHGQRSDTSMKHHLQDQIGEDCFSAPPQPSAFDFISSKLPMFAASMVGIALCVFGAAGPSHASVSRMPMPRMPAVSQQKMNVGAQALAAATVGALFSTTASRSPEDDELALPVLAHSGRTMQDVTAWQPRIIRPEVQFDSSKNVPLSPTPTAPVVPQVAAFSGSYANSLPWESTITALAAKTQSSGRAIAHPDASIPEVRSTSRGDVRDRDFRPTPGMTPSATSAPSVWAGVVNASTMGDQQQSFIDQWKEQQKGPHEVVDLLLRFKAWKKKTKNGGHLGRIWLQRRATRRSSLEIVMNPEIATEIGELLRCSRKITMVLTRAERWMRAGMIKESSGRVCKRPNAEKLCRRRRNLHFTSQLMQ